MRVRWSIAFLALTAWPSCLAWTPTQSNPQDAHVGPTPFNVFGDGDSGSGSSSSSDNRPYHSSKSKSGRADRRAVLATFASASFVMAAAPVAVLAADNNKPQEFTNVGTQAPAPEGERPFVTLANGVQIKDFRMGSGDAAVKSTSKVNIQCSGRLLNLNGIIFYNTKNNNPDGFGAIPLTIDLGQGQAVPGLEAGLIGMKKGGIRRIIVPQELAYNAFPDLEPKPMNTNDQRALDSVVKNKRRDGAILFDVQVERLK